MQCEELENTFENITEEEANTIVHQINDQRATLSVNYKPGDWDSVWALILKARSGWHQIETTEDPQNMNNYLQGHYERPQRTASGGYSRRDSRRRSKYETGSKRCKLSRL